MRNTKPTDGTVYLVLISVRSLAKAWEKMLRTHIKPMQEARSSSGGEIREYDAKLGLAHHYSLHWLSNAFTAASPARRPCSAKLNFRPALLTQGRRKRG